MTLTLTLGATTEDLDDVSGQITWPATTGLVCNPGDLILRNRSDSLTVTSSDGSVTLAFGATLVGTTVTGSGVGTGAAAPHTPYDGPFCTIAPNLVDFTDEAFADIEIYGDVGYYPEVTDAGAAPAYVVYIRSGDPIIHGSHIMAGAIAPLHLTQSHVLNGSFPNGSLVLVNSPSSPRLIFVTPNLHDPIEFHTANGDGDSLAASGWPDGSYFICSSLANAAGIGYVTPDLIGYNNGYAAQWPGSGVARSMIAFTRYHPGSSSPASFGTGGSLGPGQNLCIRFCLAKTLQVKTTLGGVASFYTQVIETPLSTPCDAITPNDGLSNHSVSVMLPTVPAGWTLRIYLGGVPHDQGPTMYLQTQGTNYTLAGNVLTLTSFSTTGVTASYGFSAWPSGTLLAKDPSAYGLLMKLAHVGRSIDPTSHNYDVEPYGATGTQMSGKDLGPASTSIPHLNASNAAALSKLLAVDGIDPTKIQYIDPTGIGLPGGATDTYVLMRLAGANTWALIGPQNLKGTNTPNVGMTPSFNGSTDWTWINALAASSPGRSIQFGTVTISAGTTSAVVTFPAAFTNAGDLVLMQLYSGSPVQAFASGLNKSSFVALVSNAVSVDTTWGWFAIGH